MLENVKSALGFLGMGKNRPLRVLFDIRAGQDNPERGVPRYSRELIKAMLDLEPSIDVAFLASRHHPLPELPRPDAPIYYANTVHRIWRRFDAFFITGYFDRFHTMGNMLENMMPFPVMVKSDHLVGIVYDLIPIMFSERYLTSAPAINLYGFGSKVIQRSDRVFAISEATKKDTMKLLGVPEEKISVIYGGIDEARWRSDIPLDSRNSTVLFIAGDEMRKNISLCIEGLGLYRKAGRNDARLTIACGLSDESRARYEQEIRNLGMTPGEEVTLTGRISDEEITSLMQNCRATIYPSLYEGLGLPVLEAYCAGTPAYASNTSSMVEITHPDCLLDPNSVSSISDAFQKIYERPDLNEASVEYGREILSRINWRSAAAIVLRDLHALRDERKAAA